MESPLYGVSSYSLTVEDKLDREDLDNINEILGLEGFSFVKFEQEAIQWKNLF